MRIVQQNLRSHKNVDSHNAPERYCVHSTHPAIHQLMQIKCKHHQHNYNITQLLYNYRPSVISWSTCKHTKCLQHQHIANYTEVLQEAGQFYFCIKYVWAYVNGAATV